MEPRFCRDCRFMGIIGKEFICGHDEGKRFNLVTGMQQPPYSCEAMRAGICGPLGRLFEAREASPRAEQAREAQLRG